MNINILSTEEIIHYVESGLIDNVPAELFLKAIQDLKSEMNEEALEQGYNEAVDKMRMLLDNL